VLWADKNSEQGVLHVEIKLSGDGEQIGLVEDFMGDTLFIDSLTFIAQRTDTSYGYINDGAGEWTLFHPASPGETNDNGVPVGIKHDPDAIVTEYHLTQNYPNPFNPLTTIDFALKNTGHVKLEVFNTAGQKVATLVNQPMKAGKVSLTWNASKLSSGLYYYRIKAGDFSAVKKMLLVK